MEISKGCPYGVTVWCDSYGALVAEPEVYNLVAMIPELTLIVPFCAPAAEVADDAYRHLAGPGKVACPRA